MSLRFPGISTLSVLGRRLTEAATCELLLFVNFPGWAFILPLYLMSYIADNPSLPIRPIGHIVRRIRGAIYRSFGLRLLATRPFASLRFYCDLDGIWLIAAEFLRGETPYLVSPSTGVFLDIGAHYGLVSARIASMLPRSSRIIAIEAHPANYNVLKRNIELNRLSNVAAFNFAIANFNGTAHMQTPVGASARYKLASEENDIYSPLVVRCYRLADVFAKFGIERADLIKLDIEGLELKVVQDCIPTLAGRIGEFDIEVHNLGDVSPMRNLLVSSGFAVHLERSGILSVAYRLVAEKTSSDMKSIESS
jgi:FkbM family methyltransferase